MGKLSNLVRQLNEMDATSLQWGGHGWWAHEEEKASNMSDDELRYAIQDAKEARDHFDKMAKEPDAGQNIKNSYGKYADQVHVYVGELRKRSGKR